MKRVLIFIAVGVLISMGRTFISDLTSAHRDGNGTVVTAGSASPVDLKVGDCIGKHAAIPVPNPSSSAINFTDTEVSLVPCAESHEWEVYSKSMTSLQEYSDPDLTDEGNKDCADAFGDFIGTPIGQSSSTFYYYVPTSDSWSNGDRNITCLVGKGNQGMTVGTLKGSES